MIRSALLLFTILPLAVMAQDEEPAPDRKYECYDMFGDDSKPYVFVETFDGSPEDVPDELPDEIANELPDGMSGEELEALDRLIEALASKFDYAEVTVSGTGFEGLAYQDGLDYRIDFGQSLDSLDSSGKLEYTLVVQADGDTSFYDFSDVESGEKVSADRLLKCNKTQ